MASWSLAQQTASIAVCFFLASDGDGSVTVLQAAVAVDWDYIHSYRDRSGDPFVHTCTNPPPLFQPQGNSP